MIRDPATQLFSSNTCRRRSVSYRHTSQPPQRILRFRHISPANRDLQLLSSGLSMEGVGGEVLGSAAGNGVGWGVWAGIVGGHCWRVGGQLEGRRAGLWCDG